MAGLGKVSELLQQEVSRKEFLRFAGVGILSVIGVTSLLNNLKSVSTTTHQKQSSPTGYGVSAYGR